jgi:hypothetical protein
MLDLSDRTKRFEDLRDKKPVPGTVLFMKDGGNVNVSIDSSPGKAGLRVMFCNAAIDEECSGWFLTNDGKGLKCLILPLSQDKLVAANRDSLENLTVRELRVVRISRNGRALICETVR